MKQKSYIIVEDKSQKRIVTTFGPIGGWVLIEDKYQWIPGPGKFVLDKNGEPKWVSYNPTLTHIY